MLRIDCEGEILPETLNIRPVPRRYMSLGAIDRGQVRCLIAETRRSRLCPETLLSADIRPVPLTRGTGRSNAKALYANWGKEALRRLAARGEISKLVRRIIVRSNLRSAVRCYHVNT